MRDQRRLAAIMSADVAGYSRLMGRDESSTLAALKMHLKELIEPKVAEYRGRIVKTMGDGLLIEFASVVDAVRCAVDTQRGMAERNTGVAEDKRIVFRIGINVGDIIIDGADIYGDGVNVAARLQALAEPGGICVNRAVRDQVRDKLSFTFEEGGRREVKNIARPVEVFFVRDEPEGSPLQKASVDRKRGAQWISRRRSYTFAGMLTILIAGVAAWYFGWPPGMAKPVAERPFRSFVVLPVANELGTERARVATRVGEELVLAVRGIDHASIVSVASATTAVAEAGDLRRLGEHLRVRYVVQSSLRSADGGGDEIAAQLIDATKGTQLWFDREKLDASAAITQSLAKLKRGLRQAVSRATETEIQSLPIEQRRAWEDIMRANRLPDTAEGLSQAGQIYEDRLRSDPRFYPALIGLAATLIERIEREPETSARLLKRLDAITMLAIEVAPRERATPLIYRAICLQLQGNFNGAFAALDEAMRREPSSPLPPINRAAMLVYAGRPAEAVSLIEQVIRIDPEVGGLDVRCLAYLHLRRDADAVNACESAAGLYGNGDWKLFMWAAAAHGNVGNADKAAQWKARLVQAYPGVTIRRLRQIPATNVPEAAANMEHMFVGLRNAGLPEQ